MIALASIRWWWWRHFLPARAQRWRHSSGQRRRYKGGAAARWEGSVLKVTLKAVVAGLSESLLSCLSLWRQRRIAAPVLSRLTFLCGARVHRPPPRPFPSPTRHLTLSSPYSISVFSLFSCISEIGMPPHTCAHGHPSETAQHF